MNGENDIIRDQRFKKHPYKNQSLRTGSLTKMDDYFTICQYKTEDPRNIEVSAPISLGFALV